MVATPTAVKAPISLDFETSVFNKEKVTLSGHEEVNFFPVSEHSRSFVYWTPSIAGASYTIYWTGRFYQM
ncbi:hypothetical protein T459_23890 [Capsicum annuum]|uniref:Uncharacterized protein n=1 Tax=Capsicum annuum TaxID=4072 RepID=A0A2G2YTY0_CAPAN|nr:hypothetical protein T459_23890 [Capsicum annuum]